MPEPMTPDLPAAPDRSWLVPRPHEPARPPRIGRVGRRRAIVPSRSPLDTAFEVVAWIGTAVALTALLIVASTVSATVDAGSAPEHVVSTGR